jgi:predicted nucleic acid-binding protein
LRDALTHLPQLENVLPFLPRAYAISSQPKSAVFDCLHVALAERESCKLVNRRDANANSMY